MSQRLTFSICLLALALHGTAWAEIYETTDAEGNPEFTDSPPAENAEVIDLQQTNTVEAPAAEPQDDSQAGSQPAAEGQAPVEVNNTIIEGGGDDPDVYQDGVYPDDVDDQNLRRDERAYERADPDAPREVGDSESQMPREVGDSMSQMPREVGDSEAQMPREVGDMPAAEEMQRR